MSDPHERLETACVLADGKPIQTHKLFCQHCATKQPTAMTFYRDRTVACDAFCVTHASIAVRRCEICNRIADILISTKPRVTRT